MLITVFGDPHADRGWPTESIGSHIGTMEVHMTRGLLLWVIGIPFPIIVLVWLLGGLHG